MKSSVRTRGVLVAVTVAAAMASLAGCERRPATTPPPVTDSAPPATPTSPASAASQ
jgi:hypothetical protein